MNDNENNTFLKKNTTFLNLWDAVFGGNYIFLLAYFKKRKGLKPTVIAFTLRVWENTLFRLIKVRTKKTQIISNKMEERISVMIYRH